MIDGMERSCLCGTPTRFCVNIANFSYVTPTNFCARESRRSSLKPVLRRRFALYFALNDLGGPFCFKPLRAGSIENIGTVAAIRVVSISLNPGSAAEEPRQRLLAFDASEKMTAPQPSIAEPYFGLPIRHAPNNLERH